jgi:hypothetical protein
MNKADQILQDIGITEGQYQKLYADLREEFSTSHHAGEKVVVEIRGDVSVRTPGTPMKREEALRMAHWIINMLGEETP